VAHDGAPYATGDIVDVFRPLKEAGMFMETKRTEGISTTELSRRIVRHYDAYIQRHSDVENNKNKPAT
jgi:choline-phosphate cytidylyltransferase